MRAIVVLALGLAAVAAAPSNPERITGGAVSLLSWHPSIASLLFTWDFRSYLYFCGGAIINNRAILTAAHCFENGDPSDRWRVRVGSVTANEGGVVHNVNAIITHENYNVLTRNNDIAILRTATVITFVANTVQRANIPLANFNPGATLALWAVGWGRISENGAFSEQLRRVELRVIAQNTCVQNYQSIGRTVLGGMMCIGWAAGGRGQCVGDSGSPVYTGTTIAGIYSWGHSCGLAAFPGVNTRVAAYTVWIQNNA